MTRSSTLIGLATALAAMVIAGLVAVLLWDGDRGEGEGPPTQDGGQALVRGPTRFDGLPDPPSPEPRPEDTPTEPARPERLAPAEAPRPRLGPDTFVLRLVDAETGRPVTACSLSVLPHRPGPATPDDLRRRLAATPDLVTRPLGAVSGVYRLDHKPGTWDLVVQSSGYEPAAAGGWLLPALDHQPVTRELSRGPGISGLVFSVDGGPVPGITVHLHAAHLDPDAPRPETWVQTTDAEGRFHFSPLPAGVYSVALHERDNMRDRYAGIRLTDRQTVRIEMVVAPRVDAVIEVRDPTGRTVAGAEVELRPLDDPRRGTRADSTDTGGRAQLRWLLPGRYAVTARRQGFAAGEALLDLPSGQGMQFQTVVLERDDR